VHRLRQTVLLRRYDDCETWTAKLGLRNLDCDTWTATLGLHLDCACATPTALLCHTTALLRMKLLGSELRLLGSDRAAVNSTSTFTCYVHASREQTEEAATRLEAAMVSPHGRTRRRSRARTAAAAATGGTTSTRVAAPGPTAASSSSSSTCRLAAVEAVVEVVHIATGPLRYWSRLAVR
jgi:hypothetical protein